jgi:hypothetical protein
LALRLVHCAIDGTGFVSSPTDKDMLESLRIRAAKSAVKIVNAKIYRSAAACHREECQEEDGRFPHIFPILSKFSSALKLKHPPAICALATSC